MRGCPTHSPACKVQLIPYWHCIQQGSSNALPTFRCAKVATRAEVTYTGCAYTPAACGYWQCQEVKQMNCMMTRLPRGQKAQLMFPPKLYLPCEHCQTGIFVSHPRNDSNARVSAYPKASKRACFCRVRSRVTRGAFAQSEAIRRRKSLDVRSVTMQYNSHILEAYLCIRARRTGVASLAVALCNW